jgi:hypothetical protein
MTKVALAGAVAVVAFLVVMPGSAAGQLPVQDSVTGSAQGTGFFGDIQLDAHSGPSGENPTGTASFRIGGNQGTPLGGPVTCLAVRGNTATLVIDETVAGFDHVAIQVVDNAATGQPDTFDASPFATPFDCSPLTPTALITTIASGDLVVTDAPPFPTSKDQCKNGAWRNYPGFKSQGDCVSFVATGGKNPPAG